MFEYSESNIGVIVVTADSYDEAIDLAQCGEGTIHIHKCDWVIGEQIK